MTNSTCFRNQKSLICLVLLVMMGLLFTGCGAHAAPVPYRVGILSGSDTFNHAIDTFKAEMREFGYKEGVNVSYDLQSTGGDTEKMKQIAEKFVTDRVDLIVTTTNNAALAARAATAETTIPVVFVFVVAPVETGIVDDLRQPGGNLTGVRNPLDDFVSKRLEFLLKISPESKHVWVPYDPQDLTTNAILRRLRQDTGLLGVELIEMPVSSPEEIVAELETRAAADEIGFEAILIMPDSTVQLPVSWNAILAFSQEHHLPIVANTAEQVEQGAILTYLSDNLEAARQAAFLADQILRGATAGRFAIISSEPQLIINYGALEDLDLIVQEGLLAQTSEVIRK